MNSKEMIRQEIIRAAQVLGNKNMLATSYGNISYRLDNGEMMMNRHSLLAHEKQMHLAIYQHSPKARCVIHAYPTTTIAWTIAQPWLTELPTQYLSELFTPEERIPIAPYTSSITNNITDVLQPFLPQSRIIILSRHSALTWGESVQEALNGMERLEHCADILMKTTLLDGLTFLSGINLSKSHKISEKI